MNLLFSNFLGDCSYSFQGSSELISITVTVSLFLAECSYGKEFPQENLKNDVKWGQKVRVIVILKRMGRSLYGSDLVKLNL